MKHLFTILLVAISATTFAQGNLEFNEVKNVIFESSSPSGSFNIGIITVPAGKVWKIQSTSFLYNYSSQGWVPGWGGGSYSVTVANQLVYAENSQNNRRADVFWLEEGTHDVILSTNLSASFTKRVAVSAIEFNVVP